jgi:ABC-type phosphate transport system auxiliary subunit
MDSHSLALLIPIMALSIPVMAIVFGGLRKTAQLRLEETRLKLQGRGSSQDDMDALRAEVDDVRRELSEVQERLDFDERLLARPDVRDRPVGAMPEPPR